MASRCRSCSCSRSCTYCLGLVSCGEGEQNEEEERRPYRNEFKLISRANSPKSHKSEESKSMDFDRLKGNVIKSVLISAGKSSISSK